MAKVKKQFFGFVFATLIFVSAYPIWSFIVKTISDMVSKF